MTSSQDTEITLGTGRMLLLFFGLVVVCAGFFGVGFTLGRNSIRTGIVAIDSNLPSATGPVVRPSAVKSNNGAEASADQHEHGGPLLARDPSRASVARPMHTPLDLDLVAVPHVPGRLEMPE